MIKELINYSDFEKLDIRVGLIEEASLPDWSEKLVCYVINFGEEIGKRTLFSGIRQWYTPQELIGKRVPVIINMTPKKMGETYSEGMVIMIDPSASSGQVQKPIMIFLPESIELGAVVR